MDDKRYEGGKSDPAQPEASPTEAHAGHPRRRTPWQTVDGRVISLISRKGGVGKTTSAVNLGAALALSGHTVLVVGVDPQCGVCRSLGTDPHELTTGLAEIFSHHRSLTDLVQTSPLRDLFYISPRIDCLEDEEQYLTWLDEDPDEFVREIDQARMFYDTILIDCPPNLGPATRSALLASDSYLVPIQAEELCRGTVEPLLEFVGDFRDRSFPPTTENQPGSPGRLASRFRPGARPIALEGVFLTMTSTRTRMGKHVAARVSEDFGNLLYSATIPRTTRLSEMALRGKPAVIYDRRSAGSRAYFDLADELVYRFCNDEKAGGSATDDPAEESATAETRALQQADEEAPEIERLEQLLTRKEPGNGGGLDRFLAELGGSREASSHIPAFEEPAAPEMVSLDDLLAEEESGVSEGDEWSDDSWNGQRRPH
jgi:chromosome partitioning protein